MWIESFQSFLSILPLLFLINKSKALNDFFPLKLASKFAEILTAENLVLMTNTTGVLDKNKKLITGLVPNEIEKLISDGTISDGMLPKINSAVHAAKHKVNSVHIIDGRVEHALLLEILTDQGVGTLIKDE